MTLPPVFSPQVTQKDDTVRQRWTETHHGAKAKTRVIVDPPRPAAEQMALDERLAKEAASTLRLFCWDPPACSLGWKQAVPAWLDEVLLQGANLEVVERPTGGGLACHGSDLSCSVVIPCRAGQSVHRIMTVVCEAVVEVCRSFGVEASPRLHVAGNRRITVCLAEPSSYAVLIGERKVAGFAVRRYTQSWLIQGSLLVRPLPEVLLRAMPASVRRGLMTRAISLSEASKTSVLEQEVAHRWVTRWPSLQDEAMSLEREVLAPFELSKAARVSHTERDSSLGAIQQRRYVGTTQTGLVA